MSIRPIDMVMMPGKSQEVSQLQHQDEQRLQQAEQFEHAFHQNQVKREQERTGETEREENKEYRYRDGKGSSQDQKRRKKKSKDAQEASGEKEAGIRISHFDMKV